MLGIILSRSFASSRNFYLLGRFPVHQIIGSRKRSSYLSLTLKEGKEETYVNRYSFYNFPLIQRQ